MLSLRLNGRYTSLFNTIRGQGDLFTIQCCHWDSRADIPPWVTVAKDRVISSLFNVVIDTQRQLYPPFNTSRGQSDLFTVQCCHWHSKADIPPIQHYQRTEWSLHCSMLSLTLKGWYTPLANTIRGQSDLFTVQCCHWHSKADIPPWST